MAQAQNHCQICNVVAKEISRKVSPKLVYINLACGHQNLYDHKSIKEIESDIISTENKYQLLRSRKGERLDYLGNIKFRIPFQSESCLFIDESFNNHYLGAGIFHEMGLGKMIIGCAWLACNKEIALPAGILCKAGMKWQWFYKISDWVRRPAQVLLSSKDSPEPDMFDVFIVSLDSTINRKKRTKKSIDNTKSWVDQTDQDLEDSREKFEIEENKIFENMAAAGVKTIILDECQSIKNPDSKRSKSLVKFMAAHPEIKFIPLSGTPLKNYPHEYFTVLNLLNRDMFPSYTQYLREDCDYHKGYGGRYVCTGLQDPERFQEKIKPFILRYTREEVAPEVPMVNRQPHFVEVDNKKIEEEYEKTQAEFDEEFGGGVTQANFTNLLAYLAKMRHLAGFAKIKPCVDFVADFLIETDRKLVIFVHHNDVNEILTEKLNQLCRDGGFNPPLVFAPEFNSTKQVEEFQKNCAEVSWVSKDPRDRILIASTLAAGEGLNLQQCSDCIILERQWNPANEEQAESRFTRIGSLAKFVNATYITAIGTIDEFFSELVEKKRAIVKQVLDGEQTDWNETSIMRELMEILSRKGAEKWKMR